MKKVFNLLTAGVVSIASALVMMGGVTPVAHAQQIDCAVSVPAGSQPSGVNVHSYVGNYTVNAQKTAVSTVIDVRGDAVCKKTVTIVSWKATDGNFTYPITGQTQYAHVTETLGVGTHTITVPIPNCYFQIDLLNGTSTTAPDGTPNYVAGQLLGWLQGDSGNCTQPTPTPTPTPVTPSTTTTVQYQPTTLVNTGPGDVIALFGLTTLVGFIVHRLYSRRAARQQ